MKKAGRPTKDDRTNALAAAVTGTGELGDPPAHFGPEAAAAWRHIVSVMPPGILQNADGFAVEALADAIVLYRRARDLIEEEGEAIKTDKGVIRHPAAVALSQHRQAIRAGCIDLGMTPQARAKIGLVAEREEADPLDDLIGG